MTAATGPLIDAWMGARKLRSTEQVRAFDDALAGLAANREAADLPGLFRVFIDATEDPSNVMWGLIHLAESYESQPYASAFVASLPETVNDAAEWMQILAIRQLNDDPSRALLIDAARGAEPGQRSALISLLRQIADFPQAVGGRAREVIATIGGL